MTKRDQKLIYKICQKKFLPKCKSNPNKCCSRKCTSIGISKQFKGREESEKQKKQISKTLKKYYEGHHGTMLGKHHTKEARKKMETVNAKT